MTHHVYYFWHGRVPLYIGVTGELTRRLRQHARDAAPWSIQATHVTSIDFEDETSAYAAEAEQIASLRPRFNVRHNPAHRSLLAAYDEAEYTPEQLAEWDRECAETIDRLWTKAGISA